MADRVIVIDAARAGQTLAAVVRTARPELSWTQARQLIASRHVRLNGELALDPARRLKPGDALELLGKPAKLPTAFSQDLVIRHLDAHVVVVEKPAGLSTTRHPTERDWNAERRDRSPTLDDRLHKAIAARLRQPQHLVPRLRKVHRLDKLTSGLLVFARSALAERDLRRQFFKHTVVRRYLAVVHGHPVAQTIRSQLVRDRGDGRRGSTPVAGLGKTAVTHVEPVERLGEYSVIACRLETGRTHQIRIHLSELGHPVCGDPVYTLRRDGSKWIDASGAPRLALHAVELGFAHPVGGAAMHWSMPLPPDLDDWLKTLRRPSRTIR